MSLTEAKVVKYLERTPSLKRINNHEVKDKNGCKTNQMPLTIAISKQWINQMLDPQFRNITSLEKRTLAKLKEALDNLPLSLNFHAFKSMVTGLDSIQKNLLASVTCYLDSIVEVNEHQQLLKAIVLVLKIITYDLSKKEGPITIGYSIFTLTILSNDQRIENLTKAQGLLNLIIDRFDQDYEQEHTSFLEFK